LKEKKKDTNLATTSFRSNAEEDEDEDCAALAFGLGFFSSLSSSRPYKSSASSSSSSFFFFLAFGEAFAAPRPRPRPRPRAAFFYNTRSDMSKIVMEAAPSLAIRHHPAQTSQPRQTLHRRHPSSFSLYLCRHGLLGHHGHRVSVLLLSPLSVSSRCDNEQK
jgi:hypothetical protein